MARSKSKFHIDLEDGSIITFEIPLFNAGEVAEDIEKYLKIDIANLVGELVVTPLMMNRFGVLLAEAEDVTATEKINYELWEAKETKKYRQKRADDGVKEPTKPMIDEHIILHPLRPTKYSKLLTAQKNESYIKSIYWAFKEKQENLKKLSLSIQGGDLDDYTISKAIEHLNYVSKVSKKQ